MMELIRVLTRSACLYAPSFVWLCQLTRYGDAEQAIPADIEVDLDQSLPTVLCV